MSLYWKPAPVPPLRDWRTYTLLIPIISASLGAAMFSMFTFAFDSVDILSPSTQDLLILIAGIFMAIGAELGTPGTITEVYRKAKLSETTPWDWTALIFSLLATLVAVLIAFGRRIDVTNSWSLWVTAYGPVAVVLFVALDTYGAYIEFGALFASYEQRYESWLNEKAEHDNNVIEIEDPNRADIAVSLPTLRWPQFDSLVLSKLNGGRATLTQAKVVEYVENLGYSPPHPKTIDRWIERAKE